MTEAAFYKRNYFDTDGKKKLHLLLSNNIFTCKFLKKCCFPPRALLWPFISVIYTDLQGIRKVNEIHADSRYSNDQTAFLPEVIRTGRKTEKHPLLIMI